jgi:hypothetical protein
MTTIRLLSAGLVATAMFLAPAMARHHHVTPRHQSADIVTAAPEGARYFDGTCVPAPRVGAFATQPWDSATPCEPTYGYGYYGY